MNEPTPVRGDPSCDRCRGVGYVVAVDDGVPTWTIQNTVSGADLGTYTGNTKEEARTAMEWDAGYRSVEEMEEASPSKPEEVKITRVKSGRHQDGGAFARAEVCECVPACALCHGTGQRRIERGGRVRLGRCRCRMIPDRVELFNRAEIPARHAASSFQTFFPARNPGTQEVYRQCQDWVRDARPREENRGLILYGGVGRGKTHLLVAMLRELILEKGVEARFVEFSHLLSALKEGYDNGTGEATTLTPLVRVPVLAIDELGKGRGTEWEHGIIDQLVSHRYNALGTILATTNYEPKSATGRTEGNPTQPELCQSLGDRVGERVLSRLREMCTFLRLGGDDYRPFGKR